MAAWMIFDVESVGLFGEGYAVGWIAYDEKWNVLGSDRYDCSPNVAAGTSDAREWIRSNVPDFPVTHPRPEDVRAAFWKAWTHYRSLGALLAADVAWPVEARFLIQCVEDAKVVPGHPSLPDGTREADGPYPLIDISSVRLAAGLDPIETIERRPDERPAHDPLADARQSARLLREALDVIRDRVVDKIVRVLEESPVSFSPTGEVSPRKK